MNRYTRPILFGLALFGLAFWDSLHASNYRYDNWFEALSLFGKICTIGVGICLLWLIAEGLQLIKRK